MTMVQRRLGASAVWLGCACAQTPGEEMTTVLPTSITDDPMGSGGDAGTGDTGDDADEAGEKLDVPADDSGTGFDSDAPTSCDQDVDIVFVMDVSTSMGPFLSSLADEIETVDQALAALDLPSPAHYGLVVFVDDFAILGGAAPYPDAATLRADFQDWSAFTSTNQQVGGGGTNTTWPENSLDALSAAATAFQWRPAASTLRLVIHTTDDTFWDGPTNANGVDIQHGYTDTVDALQEREIRVFSFAAQIGGQCECEDVTPGWSTPFGGSPPIPEATGGGVFDIDLVLAGQVSLADAIPQAVIDTMCDPYPPTG
jgi:hypothetical protein